MVCLLVLSSAAISQAGKLKKNDFKSFFLNRIFRFLGYGGGYGGGSIQQSPKIITMMRDQTIQQPFVPTAPVAPQGYGQQQQQQVPDWSSP